MNIATFPVEERADGWVYLKLPPVDELDSLLGTEKWKVKKGEAPDPFQKYDRKYRGIRGKKTVEKPPANKRAVPSGVIDW